jgi:glycosyltransferase involved in cell wall biosynthesis
MKFNSSLTVLMPVFNADKYLKQAIDSILNQSYTEFDFCIINDGSTDSSESIILAYADPRIKYYKNETNLGIVKTLNKGLELINSKYIVRMDSDDISLPERLSVQKKFMDDHPEIGVSSGSYQIFGDQDQVVKLISNDEDIKAFLIFGSSICHPAAIIRTSILKENSLLYRSDYPHMEDYDLWYRMKDLTNFSNIDKVLLKYRISGNNVTLRNYDTILQRKYNIYKDILRSLEIDLTKEDFLFHNAFDTDQAMPIKIKIISYRQWLDKLILKNDVKRVFPVNALRKQIEVKWNRVFYEVADLGINEVVIFWKISKKIKSSEIIYLIKLYARKILRKVNINN